MGLQRTVRDVRFLGLFACLEVCVPYRAARPCAHPGCSVLTDGRRCPVHQKAKAEAYREQRGTTAELGYGGPWAAYSKAYRREHPYCVSCQQEGRLVASTCVDHITPASGPADPRFWDPANHQALCTACHSRKTVVEDRRGIGRLQCG